MILASSCLSAAAASAGDMISSSSQGEDRGTSGKREEFSALVEVCAANLALLRGVLGVVPRQNILPEGMSSVHTMLLGL